MVVSQGDYGNKVIEVKLQVNRVNVPSDLSPERYSGAGVQAKLHRSEPNTTTYGTLANPDLMFWADN
jgi:hypothetical protein